MHSSLSIIKENEKEGVDDAGSSQHLLRLFHTLGPLVHAGPPIHPPTIYPADWFWPLLDAHHSWSTPLSENAPSISHTRVSLLGERIPEELFDYIIEHIWPQIPTCRTLKKTKMSPPFGRSDPFAQKALRTCTQVCRHWANKCRRYVFTGAVLVISSLEDMDELIHYAFHGCPLLIPLHKVIGGIHILQRYDASRSFYHLLHFLKMADVQVRMLELCGCEIAATRTSIPKKSHYQWSIPPTVPTSPSLLKGCGAVTVKDAHMVSFSHVVRLVRHFSAVPMKPWNPRDTRIEDYVEVSGSVRYHCLTWDNHCIHDSLVYRKPVLCRRPYIPSCVHIEAKNCTDNVRLCMYTAVARPSFAMHWMQEDERQWMFSLVMSFDRCLQIEHAQVSGRDCELYSDLYDFGGHQWPRICWQLHAVYESSANHMPRGRPLVNPPEATVTVAFCLGRIFRDTPAPTVRVVGLEVVVPWNTAFRVLFRLVGFDVLLAKIRSCPTTLVINFRFPKWSSSNLQEDLKYHHPFNGNPETEAHTIAFTYSTMIEPNGPWIRIDPVTQYPTGQTWQRHEDIIPSLVSEQSQDEHHVF